MNKLWGTTDNSEIDWVTVMNFKKEKEILDIQKSLSETLDYLLIDKKISANTWEKMKKESRKTAEETYEEIFAVV